MCAMVCMCVREGEKERWIVVTFVPVRVLMWSCMILPFPTLGGWYVYHVLDRCSFPACFVLTRCARCVVSTSDVLQCGSGYFDQSLIDCPFSGPFLL